jgi:sigma-B regulation protein RsbU (phosphoserine phosphatase)
MSENAKNGVHDLRNELLFQAQIKSNLEEPLRDQTVLVIDVKDRVIKLAK